jgi:biopolymer transport protein ExbD
MLFRKENEGITLIALVITIIVLLILAGITIATLTGDNGILTKTNEAKEQTEIGKEKEIVKLATTAVITTNDAIDKDSLQSELNKTAGDKKTEVYNYNQKLQVYFTDSKRYYEIDKNFNIELINVTNGEKRISLKCINSKKEVLKEIEIITLNDNSIIEPPEIEKYEPSESSFSKTITQDTEIDILYYYVIQKEDLVFTGLNSSGNVTENESEIKSYMIGDGSSNSKNALTSIINYDFVLYVPEEYNGKVVNKIGNYAFSRASNLTKLQISNNIITIGAWTFLGCNKFKLLEIPDNVQIITADAFHDCSGIENVQIGKGVKSIGGNAFVNCDSLKKVIYNNESTAIASNGFNCKNWTEIEINDDSKTFKVIDNVLYSYDLSKIIKVPTGYKGNFEMIDSVENIGNWSFFGCTKLRKVKFGSNIKNIDAGSFWSCTSLEEVENLDKVKTIPIDAFHNCQKLNNVIINEDVNYIGGNAFVECWTLKTVIINSPVIVKNITSANSCGCLVRYAKTIYIKESITEIGNYITQNFVTINSDKDGYIKYEKGNN